MTTVDLQGAPLEIKTPAHQPAEILFDFGAVDVSTWTWLGQVRPTVASAVVLATFVFTNPSTTELLATLNLAAIAAIGVGNQHFWEIDQLTPTHRQMFYGRFIIVDDAAHP